MLIIFAFAGKLCLRCTALHMQDGSSLSKNPRRRPPTEDYRKKDTKPKLHRGWYPGQRTQAPPEGSSISTIKDNEVNDLPFLRQLVSGEETTTTTQYYRRPGSNQRSPSQQREYLFDAEDDDEYPSDGEEESDDHEDERFDELEDNQFLAEQRDEFLRNPDTDLNCKHFSRYLLRYNLSGCKVYCRISTFPLRVLSSCSYSPSTYCTVLLRYLLQIVNCYHLHSLYRCVKPERATTLTPTCLI